MPSVASGSAAAAGTASAMPLRKRVRRGNFKAGLPNSVAPTNLAELCQFSGAATARRVTGASSPRAGTAQIVALLHSPMPSFAAGECPKAENGGSIDHGRTRPEAPLLLLTGRG